MANRSKLTLDTPAAQPLTPESAPATAAGTQPSPPENTKPERSPVRTILLLGLSVASIIIFKRKLL